MRSEFCAEPGLAFFDTKLANDILKRVCNDILKKECNDKGVIEFIDEPDGDTVAVKRVKTLVWRPLEPAACEPEGVGTQKEESDSVEPCQAFQDVRVEDLIEQMALMQWLKYKYGEIVEVGASGRLTFQRNGVCFETTKHEFQKDLMTCVASYVPTGEPDGTIVNGPPTSYMPGPPSPRLDMPGDLGFVAGA